MTTEDQKSQLKGYTQAVQEMSAVMKDILEDSTLPQVYFEKLENTMRGKVLKLVEEQS